MLADRARERELLGAETKVYNSDRCVRQRAVGRVLSRIVLTLFFQVRTAYVRGHAGAGDEVRVLAGGLETDFISE